MSYIAPLALVGVVGGTVSAVLAEVAQPDPNVTIIVALIGAFVSITTAITTAVVTMFIFRRTGVVITETRAIAKSVDGMKTDLVTASIGQAKAEGQLTGEQAQRDRQAQPEEKS